MAAPVRTGVERIVPIAFESTSASDFVETLSGYVPAGHVAFVVLELAALQNVHDYASTGEGLAHQSVWVVGRNDTGSASGDGVTLGAADELNTSAGTPMVAAVQLDPSTGDLTIAIVVTETDTLGIVGTARVTLYSWPNTIES